MKTLILFSALFFSANLCSQEQNSPTEINRYLQKSNNRKKTANVLAITGGALVISGFIVAASDNNDFLISSQEFTGIGISVLGIISGITSVPFYICAGHNKSKSRKISPQIGNFKTSENNYVTAGLKIEF